MAGRQEFRNETLGNGMECQSWGSGPRTLLFLPGGPGSGLPAGLSGRSARRWFEPFVEAGHTVHYVTRRRRMPTGHTIADMADDYAQAIVEHLGGHADLVVGESYGGMIAQYLAARHEDRWGDLAIVVAAVEVGEWGRAVDSRAAAALERDDHPAAGRAFAEYVLPGARSGWARRLLGPLIGRSMLSGASYPLSDVLVETRAELAFDAREVLPDIQRPVLLVCGDRDRFFPWPLVEETERLIPACTLVRHAGKGHLKVATSRRAAHDVLGFVARA